MKLIANNSASDIEKQHQRIERERFRDIIDSQYRQMAANLLRVLRGAGRPQMIVECAKAFVEACHDAEKAGYFPHDIDWSRSPPEMNDSKRFAVELMIKGALQIVASELIDQKTQANVGYSELHEGRRSYREYLDQSKQTEAGDA